MKTSTESPIRADITREYQTMEMKVVLRSADNRDSEAIIGLITGVLAEYGLPFYLETSDAELLDISRNYTGSGGIFEVLEDPDGKIIGSIALRRIDESICELRRMYLASGFRGQGIGKVLMGRALAEAKARGFTWVILETSSPMTEAIALYQKFGFRPIPPTFSNESCDLAFALDLRTNENPVEVEETNGWMKKRRKP